MVPLQPALAATNPPEFICHFYNVYFAHSAGGKMIGRKVSEMCLNGRGAKAPHVQPSFAFDTKPASDSEGTL